MSLAYIRDSHIYVSRIYMSLAYICHSHIYVTHIKIYVTHIKIYATDIKIYVTHIWQKLHVFTKEYRKMPAVQTGLVFLTGHKIKRDSFCHNI